MGKFGKVLRAKQVEAWAEYYLDYWDLTSAIKKHSLLSTEDPSLKPPENTDFESQFNNLLENSLSKVLTFCQSLENILVNDLNSVMNSADEWKYFCSTLKKIGN